MSRAGHMRDTDKEAEKVYEMSVILGHDQARISALLGISVSTVRRRMARARRNQIREAEIANSMSRYLSEVKELRELVYAMRLEIAEMKVGR